MISNFFVISPRGDTIINKQYRNERGANVGAHERSHTEAFFRKVKFWDDMSHLPGSASVGEQGGDSQVTSSAGKRKGDAPPLFIMPDGLTYLHVKRNGLIFACSTARNVSPNTVIEVRLHFDTVFNVPYLILNWVHSLLNWVHSKLNGFHFNFYSNFLFLFLTNQTENSSCRPLQKCSKTTAAHFRKKPYERISFCCTNSWTK